MMFTKNVVFSLIFCKVLLKCRSQDCPENWTSASSVGLGCLLFDTTSPKPWMESLDFCKDNQNSHLIEIFNEQHQEYIIAKAIEIGIETGKRRNWWIGLTDEVSEGKWIWSHSQVEADFTFWLSTCPHPDDNRNYAYLYGANYNWMDGYISSGSNYPICQFFP